MVKILRSAPLHTWAPSALICHFRCRANGRWRHLTTIPAFLFIATSLDPMHAECPARGGTPPNFTPYVWTQNVGKWVPFVS